jgi:hypothetical protein
MLCGTYKALLRVQETSARPALLIMTAPLRAVKAATGCHLYAAAMHSYVADNVLASFLACSKLQTLHPAVGCPTAGPGAQGCNKSLTMLRRHPAWGLR